MNTIIKFFAKLLGKRSELKVQTYDDPNPTVFGVLHNDYKWRKVRNKWIKDHPYCALCKDTKKLEAHHVIPWHQSAVLRYDSSNLITLCRHCHFRFGHWRNWKGSNTRIYTLSKTIEEFRKADENNQ